ncbi:phospholipase A and acyltransferase 5 isoform X2 [Cebus imitator]|uniref:phospholipase A and acyltransferase 5 isoform X2 n=1 Tax=Cebus imitator TaxID=2715852 RepID=UPI00080A790A|nr:phospholipase A and acyltransferase 5 isoform X2 [Cebus imitator]
MGLSPGAAGEYALRLPRIPPPRPKPASQTVSIAPKDQQPAPRRLTATHSGLNSIPPPLPPSLELEESVGSAALAQLPAKQPAACTLEQGRSIQQGEKPVLSLETTPSQRAEWISIPKPENEGKLIKQATEGKPRPRPGDLIEIFRIGYEHWAIYVEDDCVVHLAPPSEEFEVGSITSIFSNRAVVKYSRLEDVLHGCSWKVNNKLDGTYLPLPVDEIMQRTKKMVNKIVQYSLIEGNCEHFVNGLRYGVPRSQQVEHALMEGAKAAGAVISAVVGSIKPKPITA